MACLEDELRRFIVENFLYGRDDGGLKAEDSLLGKGVIDSTGVLELIAHLEQRYGIEVRDEDLVPENLDSLRNLVRFVESRRVVEEAS